MKQSFGERLRELLMEPPRTQSWLAERSGISQPVLSRLMSGKRRPNAKHAEGVACALGIDVVALLRGTDADALLQEVGGAVPRGLYQAALTRVNDLEKELRGYQESEAAARYYVQDTRQVVGNCMLFWRKGGSGYTTELGDAGLYTSKQAARMRETDRAWPRALIEQNAVRHVRADNEALIKYAERNFQSYWD